MSVFLYVFILLFVSVWLLDCFHYYGISCMYFFRFLDLFLYVFCVRMSVCLPLFIAFRHMISLFMSVLHYFCHAIIHAFLRYCLHSLILYLGHSALPSFHHSYIMASLPPFISSCVPSLCLSRLLAVVHAVSFLLPCCLYFVCHYCDILSCLYFFLFVFLLVLFISFVLSFCIFCPIAVFLCYFFMSLCVCIYVSLVR